VLKSDDAGEQAVGLARSAGSRSTSGWAASAGDAESDVEVTSEEREGGTAGACDTEAERSAGRFHTSRFGDGDDNDDDGDDEQLLLSERE
jgi:hypothetical protein